MARARKKCDVFLEKRTEGGGEGFEDPPHGNPEIADAWLAIQPCGSIVIRSRAFVVNSLSKLGAGSHGFRNASARV